tara:strand:- start:255 stop:878 length:624 start_codon:yes stop_codon:yes gene_type:complete
MHAKICGVKDAATLNYIIKHPYPPKYVGFICNYKKSQRYIKFKDLINLVNTEKKGISFVAVLVNPNNFFLEKIKDLNFDYYQLYDVSPNNSYKIKKKYNKKIITAITVENENDILKYKDYQDISEIILFDSKGYEKSISFDHSLMNKIPKKLRKMLAGNIQYNDDLAKLKKITDIIDISGSLETFEQKDISKINIFLNNLNKINYEN